MDDIAKKALKRAGEVLIENSTDALQKKAEGYIKEYWNFYSGRSPDWQMDRYLLVKNIFHITRGDHIAVKGTYSAKLPYHHAIVVGVNRRRNKIRVIENGPGGVTRNEYDFSASPNEGWWFTRWGRKSQEEGYGEVWKVLWIPNIAPKQKSSSEESTQYLKPENDNSAEPFPKDVVVERAMQRLKSREQNFDVRYNNCEHFTEWCIYGKPVSHQIPSFGKEIKLKAKL